MSAYRKFVGSSAELVHKMRRMKFYRFLQRFASGGISSLCYGSRRGATMLAVETYRICEKLCVKL